MRALASLFVLAACGPQLAFTDPIADDGTFAREPAQGAAQAAWEAAADWSEERGGLTLIALQGPAIVYERSAPHHDPATPVHLFSGTKSFSCPVVLSLHDRGELALSEPVVDTLVELRGGPDRDAITVRHLLDFSSGLRDHFLRLGVDGMRENQRVHDKVALAAERPLDHAPGERFVYGGAHQWVLSGFLRDKFARTALETFENELFEPLGMRFSGWHHDPAGNTALPYGAWTTGLEWLKFGALMRDDGLLLGERVLPAGLRDRCFAPSAATPAYGLTFWRNAPLGTAADTGAIRTLPAIGPVFGDGAPADTVAAAGHKDQRLYIIPSLDLVVVRLGEGDRDFSDARLLELVVAAVQAGSE